MDPGLAKLCAARKDRKTAVALKNFIFDDGYRWRKAGGSV